MTRSASRRDEPSGSIFSRVHELVRSVPGGRVVTYGDVSRALAGRISPLAVGWALRNGPGDVPWHRVVNARGQSSVDARDGLVRQRRRLEREGVRFDERGRIDLGRYRFQLVRRRG